MAGIPVVTTLHSTQLNSGRFIKIIVPLESWVIRYLAKDVIAVGYTVAEANRKRLQGVPIRIIPNAVSVPKMMAISERQAVRREITGNDSVPIVISVGRFAPPKGYPIIGRDLASPLKLSKYVSSDGWRWATTK